MAADSRWHDDRSKTGVNATDPLPAQLQKPGLPSPPRRADGSLLTLLQQRFGIESFRDFQRDAIEALLESQGRVLLVAPTGGGKSLCYQLPAVALSGTALVLCPLISLMEDQVRGLEARGIPATYIASTLSREENGRRLTGLRRGAYKVVYAAPERLAFDGFLDAVAESELSLVAVDEAHCIVQWGHDFRPDYLRIGEALDRLRPPRVIACTATATPEARAEIVRRLGWEGGRARVILRGFARPNLHLAVREVDGPRSAHAEAAEALTEALGSPRQPGGAGIVYAATRRGTEVLAARLVEKGFRAAAYHAGMDSDARVRISAGFADRSIPVVVATNAFGMGIDRPDVRVVVHAQPPSSIEAYYQEVGRAGRDGATARGLLLISGADIALRKRMASLGEGGAPASPADAARSWGLFRELLHYIDASTCRHDFILRYFGDEAESLGGCGHCDVCLDVASRGASDPEALQADLDVVRRALAGVARARGAAGMQAIASMLAGETNARVSRTGLDRLSTFGVLAGRTPEHALSVLRVLLANGWIDLSVGDYPVPHITPVGWRVMRSEVEVRVRLRGPTPRARSAATKGSRARRQPMGPSDAAGAPAGINDALFAALKAHRSAIARDKALPAYVIATDRTLTEISKVRPQTASDLEKVFGMGPARIKAYGDGLIEVVRSHGEG